jgi:hypothetical protein
MLLFPKIGQVLYKPLSLPLVLPIGGIAVNDSSAACQVFREWFPTHPANLTDGIFLKERLILSRFYLSFDMLVFVF